MHSSSLACMFTLLENRYNVPETIPTYIWCKIFNIHPFNGIGIPILRFMKKCSINQNYVKKILTDDIKSKEVFSVKSYILNKKFRYNQIT